MKRCRMPRRLHLLRLLLGVLLVSYAKAGIIEISAYSNVSKQGYSPLRNTSETSTGTGRAMDSGFHRNIFDALNMKPENSRTRSSPDSFLNEKHVVPFQQATNKQAVASDRFTPGEAYGGTVYKIQKAKHEKKKGYQYQKPNAASLDDPNNKSTSPSPPPPPPPPPPPVPPASFPAIDALTVPAISASITSHQLPSIIAGPTLPPPTTTAKPINPTTNLPAASPPDTSPAIPPLDPNLFAPNIHSHYPPPPANGETRFSGITSYLPPAAGPVADDSSADTNLPGSPPSNQYIPPDALFQFPPNIHSHYHPPPKGNNIYTNGLTSYLPPPAGPIDTYLPPSPEIPTESPTPDSPSPPDSADDTIGTIPIGPESPYPGYIPPSGPQSPPTPTPKPQMMMAMPPTQNMMVNMPPSKDLMMSMPPGPPMNIPSDFLGYMYNQPHDHFPEYFFDHDHYHHHHHHDEPTTTPEPLPPPPPAKTKNYTYYYISRVFWYTPLYFALYFAVYIVVIIVRSLATYKAQYPNRLTGVVPALGWDKIVTRSLDDMQFLTAEQAAHKADIVAQFVMKQIEEFKEKYIG